MELVLEILNAEQTVPTPLRRKTFTHAGGVIGRGEDCDWVIPDWKRHLSNHHALISYSDGIFFLTDTSSNGVRRSFSGVRLNKGVAVQIEHGSVYVLGDFEVRAEVAQPPMTFDRDLGAPQPAGSIIPDDVFLGLDPLNALDQHDRNRSEIDILIGEDSPGKSVRQCADYARIDMENLRVPELIDIPIVPEPEAIKVGAESEKESSFWELYGTALGVELQGLDNDAREAMALSAARLLKLCIEGLQQSLRTRAELKNELRLAQTITHGPHNNPLKFSTDADEALSVLLCPERPGQLQAEQSVSRGFRDLQAHQVALLTASREALRGALEQFSPQQLTVRFERDNKPLFATSGGRWRAYSRYHQALCQDGDWSERLLARDFSRAYEEQVRLISTLHADQG